MLANKIDFVRESFLNDNKNIADLKSLEELRVKYLGKNGVITNLFDELKSVPKEGKPVIGKSLNTLKELAASKIAELKQNLSAQTDKEKNLIDLSLPGRVRQLGSNHLLTQTLNEIKSIFRSLGFSSIEGPELESDYYNFEALNFPKDHPARDMQDTFFVSKDFLLRTHTTPVQVRIMEKHKPPVRAIMPGRVYRNEAVSSRSYCMFHQVDGIYVDTDVTFAELKGTLVAFAKQFYMEDLKYRFRPSFFPFTEPSAEMDITCYLCHGKGCKVCKYTGWLEILGCGMVDPNVFKMVGYDTEKYSGYAFGMGIERTAMLKYGITDIRIFFDNDFRFLKQF